MADFDLGFGVDAGTMNGAMTALYNKLYPNSFTGNKNVEFLGVTFVFSWNVNQAPTFILAPPQEGLSLLKNHLIKNALGYPRKVDRITELYAKELDGNVLQLSFSQVTFGIKAESSSGDINVSMNTIIQANSAGGKLALIPLKVVALCDNPTDQWILDNLILPKVKEAVAEMLQGISLPNLQFSGLTLTSINMGIANKHILGFTNIAGKPVPQPPFGDNWPNSPFFSLISSDAKMTIARANTSNINGKTLGNSGQINIGIGDLYYNATAVLNNLQIADAAPNSLSFGATITGNVSAGIKIGCTNIGLNFNIIGQPNPTGIITLSVVGDKTLQATTTSLNTFVIVLVPNGNPVEWLLDLVIYPLGQAIIAAFSPLITQIFNGISFSIWQIPQVTLSFGQTQLTVTPQQIQADGFAGMMCLQGQAKIS